MQEHDAALARLFKTAVLTDGGDDGSDGDGVAVEEGLSCVAALVEVRQHMSFAMPFYTKNDNFTKTGSGQTQGKHSKQRDALS